MSVKALLRQSCTIANGTGHDRYGNETVGAGVVEPCRFQNITKQLLTATGDTLVIDGTLFLKPDSVATADSRITVDGQSYIVANYNSQVDGRGRVHHISLGLQKWQAGA